MSASKSCQLEGESGRITAVRKQVAFRIMAQLIGISAAEDARHRARSSPTLPAEVPRFGILALTHIVSIDLSRSAEAFT